MKITDIKVIGLKAPLKNKVISSIGTWEYRNGMYVIIETNTDLIGLGETWVNFPSWANIERNATIIEGFKPLLIGEDPENICNIRKKLLKNLENVGNQWGAKGIIYQALSGIDIALWDLKGKILNKPICEILGGKPSFIDIYLSGLGPDDVEKNASMFLKKGVNAFKLRVGMNREKDINNIKSLRNIVEKDSMVMVDANQGYSTSDIFRIKELFEKNNVYWIEEPIKCNDFEGLKKIKEIFNTLIAAGENAYGLTEFQSLLNSVDVIQPDVTKCGGISEMLPIASLAEACNVKFIPHFYGNGIGLAATMHILGATLNDSMLEYDYKLNPLRDKCIKGLNQIENGKIMIPQGPGLGVELNWEEIEKYSDKCLSKVI